MTLFRFALIFFAFLLTILGCSTTQKGDRDFATEYPPEVASWPINQSLLKSKDFESIDIFLNRVVLENPSTATTWWADYRRAQLWEEKDKNVACENYARLAADSHFPMRRLAYLRAHAYCPATNNILERLEAFNENSFDPWLDRLALDVAITKARRAKNANLLVELLTKKSKLNIRKDEKVSLTKEALNNARKIGLQKETRELKKRIHNLMPSYNKSPSWRDYLNIANDYRYYRNFEKAREYYNKVINNKNYSPQEKLSAYRAIRNTYKMELNRAEAVRSTEVLVQYVENSRKNKKRPPFDDQQLLDAYLLMARTYWTEDQRKSAEIILNRAEKKLNKKVSLAEVYWVRGRMEEEKQKFSEAITLYDVALKESKQNQSLNDRIRWYRAWSLRKLNKLPEAKAEFAALSERTESQFEKLKMKFWLARTLEDLGEASEAKDTYEEIIEVDPLNYYSFLAHRELDRPLTTKSVKRELASLTGAQIKVPSDLQTMLNPVYIEWLIALREDKIARDYLDQVAGQYRKTKSNDIDSWQVLLQYYARSGNYQNLFTQLYALDTDTRKSIIEDRIDLVYPRPYYEDVADASSRFGLSSEFIYSIMRQESSFNPQARSHMDAFGLMQLLPSVAYKSAQKNLINYSKADDLFEPNINIPLGAAHLRELWDKYNGELVLAVASYNASERAILNWLKTRFRGDTTEFIEDIPYDETRDYVKLVLRNMLAYQTLDVEKPAVEFPEWTLKISSKSD